MRKKIRRQKIKRVLRFILSGVLEALVASIFGFLLFVGMAYINSL